MGRDHLNYNPGVYRRFARYYDAYVGAFNQDLAVYIDSLSPHLPESKVLEIGCGTGRVLPVLLNTGAVVTGVDIAEEMLNIARDKLKTYLDQGRLIICNHNFVDFPLPEQFDRVFVTFYTFNYLLSRAQAAAFLHNVYTSMGHQAILIMDLFYPAPLADPRTAAEWSHRTFYLGANPVLLSDRRTMKGRLEKREQLYQENDFESEIVTYRRFYSKAEIRGLLRDAGFGKITFTDHYDKERFHELRLNEGQDSSFMVKAHK